MKAAIQHSLLFYKCLCRNVCMYVGVHHVTMYFFVLVRANVHIEHASSRKVLDIMFELITFKHT